MGEGELVVERTVLVRMAEMAFFQGGQRAKTTLGSCVGLILHDRSRKQAALAHIMLPARRGEDPAVAKYADSAIPALVAQLELSGSSVEDIEAYLTGGAHMFEGSEDAIISSVGEQNLRATRTILEELGIAIVYEHAGGSQGRTVVFDSASAEIEVKTLSASFGKGNTK